jgi:hypothetical protein
MARKVTKALLFVGACAVAGVSVFTVFSTPTRGIVRDGNEIYNGAGQPVGCVTQAPPYNCNYN